MQNIIKTRKFPVLFLNREFLYISEDIEEKLLGIVDSLPKFQTLHYAFTVPLTQPAHYNENREVEINLLF